MDIAVSLSLIHILIRYGRGVDTSRLVEEGFEYRYTSAGAVESFARANNLRRATGSGEPLYLSLIHI